VGKDTIKVGVLPLSDKTIALVEADMLYTTISDTLIIKGKGQQIIA
jgi:hypothetical protein